MLDAFETPERDRYQVVTQRAAGEMVVQDTGPGLERSDDVVAAVVENDEADWSLGMGRAQFVTGEP